MYCKGCLYDRRLDNYSYCVRCMMINMDRSIDYVSEDIEFWIDCYLQHIKNAYEYGNDLLNNEFVIQFMYDEVFHRDAAHPVIECAKKCVYFDVCCEYYEVRKNHKKILNDIKRINKLMEQPKYSEYESYLLLRKNMLLETIPEYHKREFIRNKIKTLEDIEYTSHPIPLKLMKIHYKNEEMLLTKYIEAH